MQQKQSQLQEITANRPTIIYARKPERKLLSGFPLTRLHIGKPIRLYDQMNTQRYRDSKQKTTDIDMGNFEDRLDKMAKGERTQRGERGDRVEKVEKIDKMERVSRGYTKKCRTQAISQFQPPNRQILSQNYSRIRMINQFIGQQPPKVHTGSFVKPKRQAHVLQKIQRKMQRYSGEKSSRSVYIQLSKPIKQGANETIESERLLPPISPNKNGYLKEPEKSMKTIQVFDGMMITFSPSKNKATLRDGLLCSTKSQ